jgi:hypothetical protein
MLQTAFQEAGSKDREGVSRHSLDNTDEEMYVPTRRSMADPVRAFAPV